MHTFVWYGLTDSMVAIMYPWTPPIFVNSTEQSARCIGVCKCSVFIIVFYYVFLIKLATVLLKGAPHAPAAPTSVLRSVNYPSDCSGRHFSRAGCGNIIFAN